MSKKCRAYSESRLGLEPSDNRKAFYAGWDAALREALAQSRSDVEQPAFVLDAYRIETEFFGLDDNAQDHPKAEALYRLAKQPALPFGIGGGLVAIKTLLSRDPCAHAKVAIEMIDTMLAEQPAQPSKPWKCLTDIERAEVQYEAHKKKLTPLEFMELHEAKLKGKNT